MALSTFMQQCAREHAWMRRIGLGVLAMTVVSPLACGPDPVSPQTHATASAAPRSACDDSTARALADADVAARGGHLDRRGRILDAARHSCSDARVVRALADAWLEQGRLGEAAKLLDESGSALPPDVLASLRRRLVEAEKKPRDPDALLGLARQASARGDAVTARRRYDEALAILDAHGAPTLLFVEPTTPTEARGLRLWPARDLEGRTGTAVASMEAPDRAFRWFAGGATVVADGLVFAGSAIRSLGAQRAISKKAAGWSRSPGGSVLLVDTDEAVEQLTLPDLSAIGRVPLPGPMRTHDWLDDHRVVVRSSVKEDVAAIVDTRQPGRALAKVSGMLVAVAEDGAHLARVTSEPESTVLAVVDGRTGSELFRHPVSATGDVPTLAFSADGHSVVFVPGDGTAVVFAIPSGKPRRVGKATERPWHGIDAAWMTDDGWLCIDGRIANSSSCELRAELNIDGASRAPAGQEHACFRRGRRAFVVALPTKPQSADHERIQSVRGGASDLCARAAGQRFVVWLEGRVDYDGPLQSTRDVVLVVWDLRARRLHRTIPLTGVSFEATNEVGDLSVDGDQIVGTLMGFRFVANASTGTVLVERIVDPGDPEQILQVSDAGLARTDGGHVIDVRTGATATAPPGLSWKTGSVTHQGVRLRTAYGRLVLEGTHGERIATTTLFADGLSVATFVDGQHELLNAGQQRLGCLFGDRATELEVCEERYVTSGRYRALFAE